MKLLCCCLLGCDLVMPEVILLVQWVGVHVALNVLDWFVHFGPIPGDEALVGPTVFEHWNSQ